MLSFSAHHIISPVHFLCSLENIFCDSLFFIWLECDVWCHHRIGNRMASRIHTFFLFIIYMGERIVWIWWCRYFWLLLNWRTHTRRWWRFLISLNSIDCINFDAKTIIYWIKINCSICILRFVPLHAAAAATTNTTTRAQYNFYSWFWISSLSFSPSICCECACLRSLFYSSLQLYSPHHISYLCLPLCLLARLLSSYWWSLFARSHARFTNTLLVNFYWAQSIL